MDTHQNRPILKWANDGRVLKPTARANSRLDNIKGQRRCEQKMLRKLSVEIDKSTWPIGVPLPAGFHSGKADADVKVLSTLLLIGQLTTPTLASGVSLAEFWAWIRYVYAISEHPKLRLTTEYTTLDAHQKMILSDDFGMGFPVHWLISPLNLCAWSDGREFVKRYSALTVPLASEPKKRGPDKCPDFVFMSTDGRFHVVECKGTQSGAKIRDKQLDCTDAKGNPSGGKVQKKMIEICPPCKGQSLACGLAINGALSSEDSTLRIIDPEGDPIVTVSESNRDLAFDPILRNTLARLLRSSGFARSADVMASPSGFSQDERSRQGAEEAERHASVVARRNFAEMELKSLSSYRSIKSGNDFYRGRQVRIDLPRPLKIGRKVYARAELQQGISDECLEFMQGEALDDRPILDCAPWVKTSLKAIKSEESQESADLAFGSAYFSRLAFLKK